MKEEEPVSNDPQFSDRPAAAGVLSAPDELRHGELAAFEPSSEAVEFEALTNAEFVLGSAAPHKHDLVLGYYSVHTTPDALREGEAHISSITERLVQEGRGRPLRPAEAQCPRLVIPAAGPARTKIVRTENLIRIFGVTESAKLAR